MKGRFSNAPFLVIETLLLLAVVVPVAHVRSFGERLLLGETLVDLPPAEGWMVVLRSALVVVALQTCFAFRDLYRWNVIVRPQLVVVRLVESIITVLIGLPLLHYTMAFIDRQVGLAGLLQRFEVHPLLVMASSGAAFLVAYGLRMRWPRFIREGRLAERIAIVGHGPHVEVVEEELRRQRNPSVELVGFVTDGDEDVGGVARLGGRDDVLELVRTHDIQRIVIDSSADLPTDAVLRLLQAGIRVTDVSALYERITGRLAVERLEDPYLFLSETSHSSRTALLAKRVLDLVASGTLLILAAPLMLVTAIAIKLESPGDVFYSQERTGLNGKPFKITKFRSMRADAEKASGPVWAQKNDARITRIGKWLRKLRIDEIPQLWAVIRGDMSLVGPRPERPFFVEELAKAIPNYNQRHLVKPGVTGWAQINHSYGNTDDDAFIKLQYDLYYVLNRSVALDVAVILRTVKVVVLQKGAV